MNHMSFATALMASSNIAERIIDAINSADPTPQRPFVLGLPTGLSPLKIYELLALAYTLKRVLFKNVVTFNMDEYVGLGSLHPQSYRTFMYENFFRHVDVPAANINILDGDASDLDAECTRFEEKIKNYGGVDIFLGGLGPNGHLAFNEAGLSLDSTTRVVDLAPSTIKANMRFFNNDPEKVPKQALSVGISTILKNSREILLIVLGDTKRNALERLLNGKHNDPEFPALYLYSHPNVVVVSDHAAGGIEPHL